MEEETNIPQRVVVDASFVLSLLLPDEKRGGQAKKVLGLYQEGKIEFFAPELLKFEVVNGLRSAIKSHRLKTIQARKLLEVFLSLEIDYQSINFISTLALALKHNLSIYDASYLSLAKQLEIPLLTLDENLTQFQ